jgi:hypothetical protein
MVALCMQPLFISQGSIVIMKRFHIDWKGEKGGKVRVNINSGAVVDSFMVLDNKYIARTWAHNAKENLEGLGFECILALDDGRV